MPTPPRSIAPHHHLCLRQSHRALCSAAPDAFIAAVGAFKPSMVELSPVLCQRIAALGRIVVDTEDATHEAGDLLQAGLDLN